MGLEVEIKPDYGKNITIIQYYATFLNSELSEGAIFLLDKTM